MGSLPEGQYHHQTGFVLWKLAHEKEPGVSGQGRTTLSSTVDSRLNWVQL